MKLNNTLKDALDPNGIMQPGRYVWYRFRSSTSTELSVRAGPASGPRSTGVKAGSSMESSLRRTQSQSSDGSKDLRECAGYWGVMNLTANARTTE